MSSLTGTTTRSVRVRTADDRSEKNWWSWVMQLARQLAYRGASLPNVAADPRQSSVLHLHR
jgi:hypothetical protein